MSAQVSPLAADTSPVADHNQPPSGNQVNEHRATLAAMSPQERAATLKTMTPADSAVLTQRRGDMSDKDEPADNKSGQGARSVPKTAAEMAAERLAQVMVRDACLMQTTCYYAVQRASDSVIETHLNPVSEAEAEDQGETSQPVNPPEILLDYESVWSTDWIEWNIWLNKPCVHSSFMFTTLVLMINTLIEQPFNNRINLWGFNLVDMPEWIGHSIFFGCHAVLLGLFMILFLSMWPTRHKWLATNMAETSDKRSAFWSSTRATEQWWTLAFGFVVISSILLRVVWLVYEDLEAYPWAYSRRTIYGTVKSGVDVVWRGNRCFYLLYLSPRMRYGFSSALYVATKLGNIAGLVAISFLFHYFLIVAFLPLKDTDDGIEFQERELFFSTTDEGMYQMFVALTTANHPDVLMPSYHRSWYMMLLLFSFMAITNLFLLNVFLGVVTTQYADMVQQFYLAKNTVCEGILGSAFRLIRDPGGLMSDTDLKRSLSGTIDEDNELGITKEQFLHSIELSQSAVDMEKRELWFTIMDVDDDKYMSEEEFEKMTYIVNVVFVKKQKMSTEDEPRFLWAHDFAEMDLIFRFFPSNEALEDLAHAEQAVKQAEEAIEQIKTNKPNSSTRTSGDEEGEKQAKLYTAEQDLKRATKKAQILQTPHGSTYGVVVSLLILLSILNSLWINPAPDTEHAINDAACSDSANLFSLCLGILFLIDVIITFLSECTNSKPFYYLYGPNWFYNWTDIAVVLVTFVIVGETCNGGSTPSLYPVSGLLRVCRCVRMIQRIESFRRMYNAATRVLPAITPQLLLFVTSYYSFAVLGMALFAGCVTEVEADGGPGDWSAAPWNATMFGEAQFYYQHNFDNLYSSCMTLFMLMIQNNWHVTVSGYVACSGTKWVRAYFILFNVINAMILINIFVGVVLDMFDVYWHDEQHKMGLEDEDKMEGFFEIICRRLEHRLDDEGNKLNNTWEVSHEIDSGLLYSGITPSDAVMLTSEAANRTELSGLKEILNDSPMPTYVRTAGNKIAFANKVFAALYDVDDKCCTPEDLIGSYHNYLLRCDDCDGKTRCTHRRLRNVQYNRECLETGKPVEYEELAILKDGLQVTFLCTEKPIEMSVFKHTSVVYMFPTQGDGRMLFDTDGDGQLTADDQSNSCLDLLDASVDFGKEPVDTMTRKSLKWKPDDVALEDLGWMSQTAVPRQQPLPPLPSSDSTTSIAELLVKK